MSFPSSMNPTTRPIHVSNAESSVHASGTRPPKRICLILIVVCFSLAVTACNGAQILLPIPAATPSFTATATLAPSTATPTPAPSATPTPAPTATPTPGILSSAQIFDLISPAVVFIDTPAGTGSGVLIHDGYIVTNSHVVWPFEKVRVVFPDGSEYLDAPVLHWDLLGDLAVIGPIETDTAPIDLVDGEALATGSEVFLIGYPGEVDEFPQPTITRGLISRLRQWAPTEVTYFQTDATIGGGQSGGILVSQLGDVIGISGFSFSDAGFGLVASASDVLPRVESLIAGDSVAGLGNRRAPLEGGKKRHEFVSVQHEWDSRVYVISEPIDTEVKIKVDAQSGDVGFMVLDVYGRTQVYGDRGYAGAETGEFVTDLDAPYFVVVYRNSWHGLAMTVEASHELIPYVDLDDNRGFPKERAVVGHLDYPGDVDYFTLPLREGETVNILADSILVDPYLVIGRPGDEEEQLVVDNDSGGGVFGDNAELTFKAPISAVYLVIVRDVTGYQTGGYSLQVREPYAGAPTPMAPKPTATPIHSEFGPMAEYRSDVAPFGIQYPARWTNDRARMGDWQVFCSMATACFVGDGALVIMEEKLSVLGNPTVEEYVDLYLKALEKSVLDFELLSREKFTTAKGLAGEVIAIDVGGLFESRRFVYVHEGIGFNATFIIPNDSRDDLLPLIEYSFGTFEITD